MSNCPVLVNAHGQATLHRFFYMGEAGGSLYPVFQCIETGTERVYGCHPRDADPALLVTLYGPFGRLPPCPLPDRLRFDLACHRLGDKSPRRRAHIIELAERLADVPASGRLSRGVSLLVRLSRLPQQDSRLARAVELLELVLDSGRIVRAPALDGRSWTEVPHAT